MSAVLAYQPRTGQLAPVAQDPLAMLTDEQRSTALRLETLLRPAIDKVNAGLSVRKAASWLVKTRSKQVEASEDTVRRWLGGYLAQGVIALAPQYKGRQRRVGGWEARALELARMPGQPDMSAIARHLAEVEGFTDATHLRVKGYLDSLPANAWEYHPARVGAHYHRQNLKPYVVRDRSVIPPGLIYQGDGHSLHYYLQHPNTGHHFSAELTPWMDIGTRYIADFYLGYVESAVQSLYSLSSALLRWDHTPAMLHVDPGPGFKNRAMCDAVAGFVPRFGATFMIALPGNAKGKGDIEGWFRWFEHYHGKFQPSYHGDEVPQEHLRRLEKRIERGEFHVPTWDEGLYGIRQYITRYNERNQDGLGKRSPAALWEKLKRSPVEISPQQLLRPREIRTADRYGVKLWNRLYRAPALAQYQGREVQVEYDLHSDAQVWIYDLQGRYVTAAIKVEATPFLPASRIEELEQNREKGRLQRLERKAEQIRAESRAPITAQDSLNALESFGEPAFPAAGEAEDEGLPPLDLLDTDYE